MLDRKDPRFPTVLDRAGNKADLGETLLHASYIEAIPEAGSGRPWSGSV